jgi:hypothetical protein
MPVYRDVHAFTDARVQLPCVAILTFGISYETRDRRPPIVRYDVLVVVAHRFTGTAGECRTETLLAYLDTLETALRATSTEMQAGAERQTSLGFAHTKVEITDEVKILPGLGGASGPEALGGLHVPITITTA